MRCAVVFFTLFFALHGVICAAQPSGIFQTPESDKFLKTVFTTKNGMPQNTPTAIVQTKDGYLWLSTFGGLARFDGVKFTVFSTSNTPELLTNRWTTLYEDKRGVLWLGSQYGDLMKYENGIFTTIKKNQGEPVDTTITSLYLDKNNTLWIADYNGLKTYNLQTNQFQTIDPKDVFHQTPLMNKLTVFDFVEDEENNLWLATNNGLIRFRDNQFYGFNTTDGLPNNRVFSVITNSQGILYALTETGFGKFENGKFTTLNKYDIPKQVSPLTIDKNNRIAFVINTTLYEINENGTNLYYISDVISSKARSITFDNEGMLWIGTSDNLVQLKNRQIRIYSYKKNHQVYGVAAITEDADNFVWSALSNNLLRWRDGKFDLFTVPGSEVENSISAIAFDKTKTLWLATKNGISQFKNGKFIKVGEDSSFKHNIGALFFDSRDNLWMGSKSEGIQKYENGTVKTYTTENGLPNNTILCIFEDRAGVMWIGTRDGLSRFENGTFTNFTVENGLSNNAIRDIYEDIDGALWIGTYGGGIMRYRDGKFISISSKNGLAEDIASRILVDDNDNFWILGNQGIYTVSRAALNNFAEGKTKTVYCIVYNEKDGMEIGEGNGGNQPSGWKTHDGKLWFPMIRGGVIIDPIRINTPPPPVYIEDILLNKQKINNKEKIETNPGQIDLEINYTAINFDKPDQIQFRYKLEGFDADWQEVGSRRIAYYPYLPPGHYNFKIVATTGNDVWSSNDTNIEIIIDTPFWRSAWFYVLTFFLIIALIIIAYQLRLQRLSRQRSKQQEFSRQLINAHESERFRIAAELHDSLGQELLIIKNWALLGLNKLKNNSDVTKLLEVISDMASNALEETRSISHNLRPNHLQRFGLSTTLENMTKQIEESSRIHFNIDVENIDDLFSPQSELSIYRIVQESLTNIIKHSKAKNASVKILNLFDRVEISIQDEGVGFITQSYVNSGKPNIGFGLDNIIQRTGILGGKYSIQSAPEKGTKIVITLPIINSYDEN